jgi:hypothetical protein
MPGRAVVTKTWLAVVSMSVIWAVCAVAQASGAPAHTTSASVTRYGKAAVVRAFRAAGLGLYDTGYGASLPVTTLASTKPHQGWNVTVFIYLSPKAAAASYKASIAEWNGAGMAAAVKKNLVVAVVPTTRSTIAKKAKPWPMPDVVAKTLATLPG